MKRFVIAAALVAAGAATAFAGPIEDRQALMKGMAKNTKELAEAARNAMQIASDIAWKAFDAGKFEEAATWFATSALILGSSFHFCEASSSEGPAHTAASEISGTLGWAHGQSG